MDFVAGTGPTMNCEWPIWILKPAPARARNHLFGMAPDRDANASANPSADSNADDDNNNRAEVEKFRMDPIGRVEAHFQVNNNRVELQLRVELLFLSFCQLLSASSWARNFPNSNLSTGGPLELANCHLERFPSQKERSATDWPTKSNWPPRTHRRPPLDRSATAGASCRLRRPAPKFDRTQSTGVVVIAVELASRRLGAEVSPPTSPGSAARWISREGRSSRCRSKPREVEEAEEEGEGEGEEETFGRFRAQRELGDDDEDVN